MRVRLQGESLNWLVRRYPECFYPQTWYHGEVFAARPCEGLYPLDAQAPAAAWAKYVIEQAQQGVIVLGTSYHATSDRDRHGDLVYVGRTAEYGGLQIHRLLKPQIEGL